MIKRFINAVIAASLALSIFPSGVLASMIASDDFQSYAVGALAGNNGGTGWSGAWSTTAPVVVTVVDPATDLQGNRAIAFTGNNNAAASRTLSTSLNGDVFVDFLIQFNGTLTDNDFLGLYFGSDYLGPNIGLKGNLGPNNTDLFVRTNGVTGSWLTGSDITTATTYRLFGHLYKSTPNSNYNRFDAWLNPSDAEISTLTNWDARFTNGSSSISSISQIGFRTANLGGGDSVLIDNLSIMTAPVPEPGTMALLGFGMLGLAIYGKRRMNKEA